MAAEAVGRDVWSGRRRRGPGVGWGKSVLEGEWKVSKVNTLCTHMHTCVHVCASFLPSCRRLALASDSNPATVGPYVVFL